MSDQSLVGELCERHQISEAEFYEWRETSLVGATEALASNESKS